jgi:hypothetical protein
MQLFCHGNCRKKDIDSGLKKKIYFRTFTNKLDLLANVKFPQCTFMHLQQSKVCEHLLKCIKELQMATINNSSPKAVAPSYPKLHILLLRALIPNL